jgi:cytoskeletal protein CcmA (bactofilin family)
MFSKKDIVSPVPSITLPAAPVKRAAKGTVPSIISADLTVTGTLVSSGDIQIDGIVEGDVRSVGLVIGEKAEIHGEILAEDLTVRGRVMGRIRARKVQLSATSHVEGDILHEAFAVEAGAFFEGNCRHSDNPLGEENLRLASPQPKPSATVQSAVKTAFQEVQTGLAGLAPLGQPAE